MIQQIIIISLIITAIHATTWEGMLFHRPALILGDLLDKLHLSVLRKPLFECLICMGGVYTLAIYPMLYALSWQIVPVMLGVIGMNTLISTQLCKITD